jgi:hypothetical protein
MTDEINVISGRDAAFTAFYRSELDGQVRRAWMASQVSGG